MAKLGRPREFSDADIRIAPILRERGFKWRHVALIMGRDSYSLVNAIKYMRAQNRKVAHGKI